RNKSPVHLSIQISYLLLDDVPDPAAEAMVRRCQMSGPERPNSSQRSHSTMYNIDFSGIN
ncbi:hypothetical protein J6590_030049, partial [Homalodisca vitripennis]